MGDGAEALPLGEELKGNRDSHLRVVPRPLTLTQRVSSLSLSYVSSWESAVTGDSEHSSLLAEPWEDDTPGPSGPVPPAVRQQHCGAGRGGRTLGRERTAVPPLPLPLEEPRECQGLGTWDFPPPALPNKSSCGDHRHRTQAASITPGPWCCGVATVLTCLGAGNGGLMAAMGSGRPGPRTRGSVRPTGFCVEPLGPCSSPCSPPLGCPSAPGSLALCPSLY